MLAGRGAPAATWSVPQEFPTTLPKYAGERIALRELARRDLPPIPVAAPPSDRSPAAIRARFVASVRSTFEQVNAGPHGRDRGVWYAADYRAAFGVTRTALPGVTDERYFKLEWRNEFCALAHVPASDALLAFLSGLTVADCGNVVQAAVLKALLDLVGRETFDLAFSRPTSPLWITQLLFDEGGATFRGNPLLDLFDDVALPDVAGEARLQVVQPGDVCHIGGVPGYRQKHPAGAAGGWNVVCVGENDRGEKLFAGFGPKSFRAPMTYAQLRAVMQDAYAKPQTEDDRELLALMADSSDDVERAWADLGRSDRSSRARRGRSRA